MSESIDSNDLEPGELSNIEGIDKIGKLFELVSTSDYKFICVVWGKPTLNCCSLCKTTFYCSAAHQEQDWERHEEQCHAITDEHSDFPSEIHSVAESNPANSLIIEDDVIMD